MDSNKPLGYINFDGIGGESNEIEIRIPGDRLEGLQRGQYILLNSHRSKTSVLYLARIIRGPFFVPDAVSKDSAYARASVLQADTVKFRPDFHGVCTAELLGEITDENTLSLTGTSTRPLPQTAVQGLSGTQVEKLLTLSGDMFLGELSGYADVRVCFKGNDKRVLPRNLGIFGTVGSGKTNTSQVLIEEAAACGWAVIVLDVEGEYVEMDAPNGEVVRKPAMKRLMERFGVEPRGVQHLSVWHCVGTEAARPKVSQEFGLLFEHTDPYVLAEILNLAEAQADRFFEVYNELVSSESAQRARLNNRQRPHQGSLVQHLTTSEETHDEMGVQLQDVIATVRSKVRENAQGRSSWQVLLRKLEKLQRYGIFDTGKKNLGDYSELLQGGLVSVIDVSNSQNDQVNNIVISDVLRGLFRAKLQDRSDQLPPVMVVIEEAHTFVSKEKAGRMEATLDILRDISRRGRKRWLSLCFISQQPAHLPSEIYELCNTKIVHQTTGGKNMEALRSSSGDVNAAIWQEVPVLGQGRCLIVGPQFRHPILCDVRPCSSNRRFTE